MAPPVHSGQSGIFGSTGEQHCNRICVAPIIWITTWETTTRERRTENPGDWSQGTAIDESVFFLFRYQMMRSWTKNLRY